MNDNPQPVKMVRTFQMLSQIVPKQGRLTDAFEQASNILYQNFYSFARFQFPNMPKEKQNYEMQWDGKELDILYLPDTEQFVTRRVTPDDKIAHRIWTTDIAISPVDTLLYIAVKISVITPEDTVDSLFVSRPNFIFNIIKNVGLSDIIPITTTPYDIQVAIEVEAFVSFLKSKNRTLPVLLITECNDKSCGWFNGYMIDADKAAESLSGFAHVFRMSASSTWVLTQKVGKQWTCFDGAVRIYYPGLDMSEQDSRLHTRKTAIQIWTEEGVSFPQLNTVQYQLIEEIKQYSTHHKIIWSDYDIQFYPEAKQALIQNQIDCGIKTEAELRKLYNQRIEQLKAENKEYKELADSYYNDYETEHEIVCNDRELIAKLKMKIEMQRYLLGNINNAEGETVPTTGTFEDIPAWAETYYPDRLLILPRAKRTLKTAVYENPELIYKCLQFLAVFYYQKNLGIITQNEYMNALKNVDAGLEDSNAIFTSAAGLEGDEYFVNYKGHRRKIERHLGKGNSKDCRYCLRIYFFWDEEDSIIVICDMPEHLDTRYT